MVSTQDLEQDPGGPGLSTHWQQRRGLLSAAGASRHLNVWDMGSEQMWKQWEVMMRALVLCRRGCWLCNSLRRRRRRSLGSVQRGMCCQNLQGLLVKRGVDLVKKEVD